MKELLEVYDEIMLEINKECYRRGKTYFNRMEMLNKIANEHNSWR